MEKSLRRPQGPQLRNKLKNSHFVIFFSFIILSAKIIDVWFLIPYNSIFSLYIY